MDAARAFADAAARLYAPLPPWDALPSPDRAAAIRARLFAALDAPPAAAPGWLRHIPAAYHRVPGSLRFAVLRAIVRISGRAPAADGASSAPPPIDEAIAELWSAAGHAPTMPAWPGGARAALCLTHDVDTPRGVAGAMRIAELEARHGVRSAFYAPGDVLARATPHFRELAALGFEIGLHGLRHDFGEAHAPTDLLAARYGEATRRFAELGVRGFRAPALATTPAQQIAIAAAFEHDSSSSPERCGTTWPFRRRDGLVVLPVTGALDDTLLARGVAPADLPRIRLAELDAALAGGGVLVTADHTERHLSGGRRGAGYRDFLAALADLRAWVATPSELSRWGRDRPAAVL